VRWLLTPAVLVVAVFAAALSALLRYSVLEFVPGSLVTGGLTVANFTGIMSRQYLGAVWDTVLLSAATTALTLVASYPVAYVLARSSARVRSALLVLTLAPFFTGAIVSCRSFVSSPAACLRCICLPSPLRRPKSPRPPIRPIAFCSSWTSRPPWRNTGTMN